MNVKLTQVDDLSKITVNDKDVFAAIQGQREPVFIVENFPQEEVKNNDLVELEVYLRKGKRIGLITA